MEEGNIGCGLHLSLFAAGPRTIVSGWDHIDLVSSSSIPNWLPDWAHALGVWMFQPLVLTLVISGSILLFVLSLIGLPVFLTRMPPDFFSRPQRRRLKLAELRRPFWFVVLRGLKNLLGGVLFLVGLLMLFMPGQGLLTVFAALFLLDFPGKKRFQRWIITRPAIHRPINALRRRVGRLPLELPLRDPGPITA